MNYPVCLNIAIQGTQSKIERYLVMRGNLIAEPRVGGIIKIPDSIEMDGPGLEISSVIEDLERHWLDIGLETPEDMSFAGKYRDNPEKVLKLIEQAMSRCGWYAIGPDGTADTRDQW